jgi:hypothetical protein
VCIYFLCVENLKIDSADVWFERQKFEDAYEHYVIASLYAGGDSKLTPRVESLEKQNAELKKGVF